MACTIDFRNLDEGFGGKTYKRKRACQEAAVAVIMAGAEGASMEVDEPVAPPAKRWAVSTAENPNTPILGHPTYDGVIAGRVSGRNWKQPRKHRTSAVRVSVKGTSYEEREKQKLIKMAYRERMQELKETIRVNKVEKRKKKEEREKKKKENVLKSGTKLQKITNPKTLQRISKSKQKYQLKVVPDELLNKKKK